MTLNNTQSRLVLISLFALALFALLLFGFYRIYLENRETARLLTLAGEGERREILNEQIKALREKSSAEIAAFETLGLSTETLVPTIESIEAAGRALGLETEITSVERAGPEGAPAQVKISVESRGSWRGSFSLLKALESLPQKVVIERALLSKTAAGWRSQIDLSLQSFD